MIKGIILVSAVAGVATAFSADVSGRKMVWAHYVPWYTPDNASQTPQMYHSYPQCAVGENPYRDEIKRALDQGIDGFFNDMVAHKGGETAYWDLRPYLKAAEGTPFLFGICLDVKTTVEQQVKELVKMLSAYGNHSNYPKWGDRYVIDTYTFLKWTPDEWRAIRKGCEEAGYPLYVIANVETGFLAFDAKRLEPYIGTFERAYHFAHFGMDRGKHKSIEREVEECAALCEAHGAKYMPCVWPGYYGAWMWRGNCFYQPFYGFDMAQRRFDTYRLVKDADWLHLTTYNDHGETTLCPRRHVPGNQGIIRAMSDEFKGGAPSKKIDVQFAYLREVIPGTMLRIESMRLPTASKDAVTVSGVLRGADGKALAKLDEKTFADERWSRFEWLVSTTDIAATPYLEPEFTVRRGKDVRTVRTPRIMLVLGWLVDPVTVKVSVDDCADVPSKLNVSYRDGVLSARCAFKSDVPVERAVLFRNDRPIAAFCRDTGRMLNVFFTGHHNVILDAKEGTVVSAVKKFERNGARDFKWDAHQVASYRTPGWMLMSAKVRADAGCRLVFSSADKSVTFTPEELAKVGRISVGGGKVWLETDGTIYDLPPLGLSKGELVSETWAEAPKPDDVYWVEFERTDGRVVASRPEYPFAPSMEPIEVNVVETPVTLDRLSEASGLPGMREFMTPEAEWPVRESRVVKAKVSPQSVRSYRYEKAKGGKVPARCWPMGSFRLNCKLTVAALPDKEKVLFDQLGWNEGPSLVLQTNGVLRAEYSYGTSSKRHALVAKDPAEIGKQISVELASDCTKMAFAVDGAVQGSCELPPRRVYGNCLPRVSTEIDVLEITAKTTSH